MDGWSVRLVAGVMLTFAGACAGRAMADVRKKRVRQLKDICRALERLQIAMIERRMPLEQALTAAGCEGFAAVSSLIKSERSVYDAWKKAQQTLRAKGAALSMLEGEDILALDNMFSALGLTGLSEQRLLLSDTGEALRALYDSARKKADEQARLYSTLGMLTGLAVAILLI
ncbi:MAG: stage III sporulation protein AB [Clostridia bacterium]|nr:stage III sporulation protein AB [Clostridia bacterium]